MNDHETGKCAEVLDDIALLVDGNEEALARWGDHLAECDACRDAVHDARLAARVVVDAGKDYEPPRPALQGRPARRRHGVRSGPPGPWPPLPPRWSRPAPWASG
jgi:hypothetical protein